MTLEEALVEVYESTDEQSDLNIYAAGSVNLATPGSVRLKALLERAQNAVALWKFPNGRRLRFRFLRDAFFSQFTTVSGHEANSGGSFPGFVIPMIFTPAASSDTLRDHVAFFADIAYPIVTNTPSSMTVAVEMESDPAGTKPLVTKPWWLPTLPGGKKLIQVVGLYDVAEETKLARSEFEPSFLEKGRPAAYRPIAGGVQFDVCPEEDIYYRVEIQRYPVMPASLAASFELPEAFHDAICEYAKYTANMRIGKSETAQLSWARCQQIMASVRLEADMEEDVVDYSVQGSLS